MGAGMSSSDLIPDWMKEEKHAIELAAAQDAAQRATRRAAESLIRAEQPGFWKELAEKLKIATDALPHLGLAGKFEIGPGDHIKVTVRRPDVFLRETFTDLSLKADRIQCTTLDVGFYNLLFCAISDTAIAVINEQDTGDEPMNSEAASEFVMKRMINFVRSPASSESIFTRR
jgi:glycogen debranching enzyme